MKDAEDWWRELEFERRQRHQARGLRFVGWHSPEVFALPLSMKNESYTPVPHGLDYEWNHCLGDPTPLMISYCADLPRMLGSTVREHLDRVTEFEIEATTLGAFLPTVRYEEISWLAKNDMTRDCGEGGVSIQGVPGIIQKWFEMATFGCCDVCTAIRFWRYWRSVARWRWREALLVSSGFHLISSS